MSGQGNGRGPGTAPVTRAVGRLLASRRGTAVWAVAVMMMQFMNGRTLRIRCAVSQLVLDTGYSDRQVRSAIEYLIKEQIIVRVRKGNQYGLSEYDPGANFPHGPVHRRNQLPVHNEVQRSSGLPVLIKVHRQ